MEDLESTAKMLLDKLSGHLEKMSADDLTPQAAKQTSSALKDIRDLLTAQDESQQVIRVVLPEGFEEYAQ